MSAPAEFYEVTVLEGSFGWPTPHCTDAKSVEAIRRAIENDHDLVRIAVCHRRTGAVKGDEIICAYRVQRVDARGENERCVFLNPRSTNPEMWGMERWPEQLGLSHSW